MKEYPRAVSTYFSFRLQNAAFCDLMTLAFSKHTKKPIIESKMIQNPERKQR